jgi:hypothetical protein
MVPLYNTLQATLVLAEEGYLDAGAVVRMASAFVGLHRFDHEAVAHSYLDLVRRGHLRGSLVPALREATDRRGAPGDPELARGVLQRSWDLLDEAIQVPSTRFDRQPSGLDYIALARQLRGAQR